MGVWRKRLSGAVVCALAAMVVVGCGGDDDAAQTAQAGPGGPGGQGNRVVVVETQPIARGSIARQVTVSGVVEPVRTVGVNSQHAGAVRLVTVQEGDRVRRGTVLARMDASELVAQLASAEATLDVARAAYERAEQLRERRVITLPEYERDRTAFAAARAQVDQLRARVGYATVTAPVDGIITEKNVESGDVVGNQARLFSIADVSEIVTRVGVSELDIVQLQQGDRVAITLDAFPNQFLSGSIRRVFPSADPTTRLVPVEVRFDAQSAQLARPGFLARITFDLASSDGVLLLPVSAVLGAQGSQAVFIVREGVAQRRSVTTGLTSQGRVEIVSGLEEGEEVVVVGNNTLRDGMNVRVAGAPPGASPVEVAPGAVGADSPAAAPPTADGRPQSASPAGAATESTGRRGT